MIWPCMFLIKYITETYKACPRAGFLKEIILKHGDYPRAGIKYNLNQ